MKSKFLHAIVVLIAIGPMAANATLIKFLDLTFDPGGSAFSLDPTSEPEKFAIAAIDADDEDSLGFDFKVGTSMASGNALFLENLDDAGVITANVGDVSGATGLNLMISLGAFLDLEDLNEFDPEDFIEILINNTIIERLIGQGPGGAGFADTLVSTLGTGNTLTGDGEFKDFTFDLSGFASADPLVLALMTSIDGEIFGMDSAMIKGEVAAVPEPTTLSLLAFGLAGIAWVRRRKLA